MIKLLWFIPPPAHDIVEFERWYQDEHIPNGMRQERLKRFRVNRSFYPQPPFVQRQTGTEMPRAYRFSEGYWDSVEDIRHCYASPNGRAALADGTLNIRGPATPPPPSPVLVAEERPLPVKAELGFNFREGRYSAPDACKLFGFLRLKSDAVARFDENYLKLADEIAADANIRGHAVSHTLGDVIQIGRIMRWPPAGAEHFDRVVEYYFDDRDAMDRFCASAPMKNIQELAVDCAEAITWDAAQIQEVFYTAKGNQPLEASWKALYPA